MKGVNKMAAVNLSKVYSDLFDNVYWWGGDEYRGTIDGEYYHKFILFL